MSDNQKANSTLNSILENCKSGLIALHNDNPSDFEQPDASFAIVRTDFVSILSLLYAATTKVALALKPVPSPEYKAALVPLRDLSNNTAALVHSVQIMRCREGATLAAEYSKTSRYILTAIQSFVIMLLQTDSQSNEETFVAAGKIHELIDMAKKSDALPVDNRSAVKMILSQNQESLADGWEELQEIGEAEEDQDQDKLDDGWDELGLGPEQKYTPQESERIDKARALIKMANLLHNRVIKDILCSNTHQIDDPTLDQLALHSSELLSSSDELISSMYTPQQSSVISSHLSSHLGVLKAIQKCIVPREADLDQQLDKLSISGKSETKTKWFRTCFEQIEKAGARIAETLSDDVHV